MSRKIGWGIAIAVVLAGAGIGGYHGWRCLLIRHAPPADRILYQAMRADLEAKDYSGETETVTFVRKRQMKATTHILHQAPGKYKVTYLSGPQAGMTVGSDGWMSWRCGTKGQVMEVTNATISAEEATKRFPLLLENYEVRVLYPNSVADRPVWVLDVKPKHAANAWKRFWVDQEQHVILRSESYDARDNLRSRTTFRKIEFGVEIDPVLFVVPTDDDRAYYSTADRESAKAATLAALRAELGFRPLLPTYTPRGYSIEGYYHFDHRCCRGSSAMIRYVDGLNSISLFEAIPASPDAGKPDQPVSASLTGLGWVGAQFGSSNIMSDLETTPQVVLVGDVSKSELAKMAQSLE